MNEKDGLKSWVVLVGVTFTSFFVFGAIKSFGVLLPNLTEQLSTHTLIVGSSISIIHGWGSVLGLSARALVKTLSPRVVIMTCGLISTTGLIVCAFATNVYILLVGILLTGFLLLQEVVSLGIVPDYFEKHYETAVSFYCSGTALGITVMPVLTQIFLQTYGWSGALLLISAICLHAVPFGVLLKPRTDRVENNPLLPSSHQFLGEDSSEPDAPSKPLQDICKIFGTTLFSNLSFFTKVLMPGFVYGYVFTGWLIYIVSFALEKGASEQESAIVASFGGIGVLLVRMTLPLVHKVMTFKQVVYTSSVITAISLILTTLLHSVVGICVASVLFGVGIGALGTEMYIATKDVGEQDQYVNVLAWCHLFYGFAALLSGFFTGWVYEMTTSFALSFVILAAVSLLPIISLGLEEVWTAIRRPL